MKKTFILAHRTARANCIEYVSRAPDGFVVSIAEPTRNTDQNARFHAMAGDVARQCLWLGKKWSQAQWKVLLVSGHAVATKEGAEIVAGLEGEFVNIRESTALMSVKRSSSLIEYTRAFGDMNGVEWTEPIAEPA